MLSKTIITKFTNELGKEIEITVDDSDELITIHVIGGPKEIGAVLTKGEAGMLLEALQYMKTKNQVGRPTREAVKFEAAKIVEDNQRVEEDLRRLGL